MVGSSTLPLITHRGQAIQPLTCANTVFIDHVAMTTHARLRPPTAAVRYPVLTKAEQGQCWLGRGLPVPMLSRLIGLTVIQQVAFVDCHDVGVVEWPGELNQAFALSVPKGVGPGHGPRSVRLIRACLVRRSAGCHCCR
jgi:hypothetical protein